MNVAEVAERSSGLLDEVERAVVGKRAALELVLLGLLADGHVLIEDFPGLAKTLIARSFAQATGLGFGRIQFTPDLMPSDVTGSSVYNQRTADFEFRPGPIFTNLLLADEINRAPPKTQAALLEAMQERQVTTEGETRPLERPFLVLATQNPIEHEGTYPAARGPARPLPAAHLGRLPVPRRRARHPRAAARPAVGRRRPRPGRRRPDPRAECRRRSRTSTSRRASATTSSTSSARPATRRASRSARARAERLASPQARPRPGRARGPRLRRPGRRQGGRRAGARAPADAPARALGAAGARGGRRGGAAGDGADAAGGRAVSREASPKVDRLRRARRPRADRRAVLRRPELAALGAPFLVLLAAGLLQAGDPELRASAPTSSRTACSQGDELDVEIQLRAARSVERLELLLELPPGLAVADGDNPCGRVRAGR